MRFLWFVLTLCLVLVSNKSHAEITYTLRYNGPEFFTGFRETPNVSISGYLNVTSSQPIQSGDVYQIGRGVSDYSFSVASPEEYQFGYSSTNLPDNQFISVRFGDVNGRLQVQQWNLGLSRGQGSSNTFSLNLSGGDIDQLAEDQYFEPSFSRNRQVRYAHPGYVLNTSIPRLKTWSFSERVETQTVLLDFEGAPFSVVEARQPLFLGFTDKFIGTVDTVPTSASSVDFDRTLVAEQIEASFRAAGVTGVRFVTDIAEAGEEFTTLHFGDGLNNSNNKTRGVAVSGNNDRFNSNKSGRGIVLVNKVQDRALEEGRTDLESVIAEVASHEVGHLLGLRHIQSGTADSIMNSVDLSDSPIPRFLNRASTLIDGTAGFSTHNPVYHLLRYVDRVAHETLVDQGILPGDYDLTSSTPSITKLVFDELIGDGRFIFNVLLTRVSDTFGDSSYTEDLLSFDALTLEQLNELQLEFPSDEEFILTASSVVGGETDIFLATGENPLDDGSFIFSANQDRAFSLFQLENGSLSVLASGAFNSVAVPEPASSFLVGVCVVVACFPRRRCHQKSGSTR